MAPWTNASISRSSGVFFPDGADLVKAQLPGQDHPAGAQVIPGPGGFVVADACLGGDVPLAPGGVLPCHGERAQICYDQRVHPRIRQTLQVLRQTGDLFIAGHGIDGAVDPDAVAVGKRHRLRQFLRGEIARKRAHAEIRSGQVHRIGSIEHGHFQPFHISCRSEELRFVPFIPHSHHCSKTRCARPA